MPNQAVTPRTDYVVGLDLGQSQDPSAIAVLRRRVWPREPARLDIVHLRRYQLGTPYTTIIEQVVTLLNRTEHPGSGVRPLRGCVFGLDQTGVGRPVVDMFVAARPPVRLHPVTITAGHTATRDADGYKVPKKDLVAVVQVLLQSRRLKWDAKLPFAAELARELADFQVRVTAAANEQFGTWREGQHDDLVLAVAIAAWLAEEIQPILMGCKPSIVPGMAKVQTSPTIGYSRGFQL